MITPRLHRLATALIQAPRTIRELVDLIPTNNPAEYIGRLREDFGIPIECERVEFITADGAKSWYGRYIVSEEARAKLRALVSANEAQ